MGAAACNGPPSLPGTTEERAELLCCDTEGKLRVHGKTPRVLGPGKCSRGCKLMSGSAGCHRAGGSGSFPCREAAPTAGVQLSALATHGKSLVGELLGTGCVCDHSGVAPLLSHRPSGLAQPFQVFPPTSHLHLLGIPAPAVCPVESSTS